MTDDLARLRNLQATLESGDIDAAAYQRGLDRLRGEYSPALVDALLAHQQGTSTTGGGINVRIATDSGSIAHAPVSLVGHAEQVLFPPSPDPALARSERVLVAYL